MVKYPFKKAEAQNIVSKKREEIMKKNKNFFLVSPLKTAIFVEFDEKIKSVGTKITSSGIIHIIPKIPFIPNALKKDESVNPNTNPRFAKTKRFANIPNLKNADINKIIAIPENSFIAPMLVLYLFTDAVLFKKDVRYSFISRLFSALKIPE